MPFLNQQERARIIEGAIVVAVVAGPLLALFINPPLGLIVSGVSLSVAIAAMVDGKVEECQKNKPGSSIQPVTNTEGAGIVSRQK